MELELTGHESTASNYRGDGQGTVVGVGVGVFPVPSSRGLKNRLMSFLLPIAAPAARTRRSRLSTLHMARR